MSRHGIRYPGRKHIENGHAIILKMRRHGANPLMVDRLQSALESLPPSEAVLLSQTGAEEQRELGRRTGQRFASAFRQNDRVTFVSSSVSRVVSSRKNFERGFREGLGWNVSSSYQQRDDLLRFFDHRYCSPYIATVKDNQTACDEYYRFREKMYPHVVQSVAKRLSVDNLNISDGKFYAWISLQRLILLLTSNF